MGAETTLVRRRRNSEAVVEQRQTWFLTTGFARAQQQVHWWEGGRGRGVGSSEGCCEVGTLKLNGEVWGRDQGPKSFWRGVGRHGACSRVAAHAVTPVDLHVRTCCAVHVHAICIKKAIVTSYKLQRERTLTDRPYSPHPQNPDGSGICPLRSQPRRCTSISTGAIGAP